jgi:hypothetical protein
MIRYYINLSCQEKRNFVSMEYFNDEDDEGTSKGDIAGNLCQERSAEVYEAQTTSI